MTNRDELQIERERFQRERAEMNRLHEQNCEVIHEKMDDLLGVLTKKNGILTFDNLKQIPLLEKYSIDPKIDVIKIRQTQKNIVFETYMQPHSSFSLHSHDCYEVVEVIEGHYIDEDKRKEPYLVGDRIIYGKMEKHQPKSEIKSKYVVSFIK